MLCESKSHSMRSIFSVFSLLFVLAAVGWMVSCQKEEPDRISISGKINNFPTDLDSVYVFVPDGFSRGIPLMVDGTFSDTMRVNEGMYLIQISDLLADIYMRNGDRLHLETDYADEQAPIRFSGKGSSVEYSRILESFNEIFARLYDDPIRTSNQSLDSLQHEVTSQYNNLKTQNKNATSTLWRELDRRFQDNLSDLGNMYQSKSELESLQGQKLPEYKFQDLEGRVSRSEYWKGKYVYIDVWAQWCAPCLKEIPALKKLHSDYEDYNIQFVSLSVDQMKDFEKWQDEAVKQEMLWLQLIAPESWDSDFVKFFQIRGIPRYILLDPEGGIIDADAPRPTDMEIRSVLDALLKS